MNSKIKRFIAILLTFAMLFTMSNTIFIEPAMAADTIPTFSSGSGSPSTSSGMPTNVKGKVKLALYYKGNNFPGEPAVHSGGDYVSYTNTFAEGSGYFDATEVLVSNLVNSDKFVKGSSSWGTVSGIYDTVNGVDKEFFTEDFQTALAYYEQDMVQDVLDEQGNTTANSKDYEIVWYVIKYQSIDSTWHVNGLIREKDKYSVTYNGNGNTAGNPPNGVIDMSYSSAQAYKIQSAPSAMKKTNHTFLGWNTKADGSGVFYTAGQTADLTLVGENPIILYAQWKENAKVTATWKDGDGNTIHMDTVTQGSSVTYNNTYPTPTKSPTATKEYVWDGWSTSNGGNKVYDQNPTITVNSNTTLYAHFTEQTRTYTVTWVNNTVIHTDSGLTHNSTVTYDGTTPTKNTTETEGYLFDGWSKTDGGSKDYEPNATITVTGDTTLYAHFTLVPMRTINWYNEAGSTLLYTTKALEGSTVSYPYEAPTKAGHTFKAWFTGAGIQTSEPLTVSGNMNLYPRFTANTYTVTWQNHDGTTLETDTNVTYNTTPVYNGSTPTKPSDAKYNYTFSQWSPTVSAVTGDVTYTAQFEATQRPYTVIWQNYDGSELKTETLYHGNTPAYTGTPTRPDTTTQTFVFESWSPALAAVPTHADANDIIRYTANYTVVDKTFTATVNVLCDPTITNTGSVTGGHKHDITDMLGAGVQLYLRNINQNSEAVALSSTIEGIYTTELTAGTYEVLVKGGNYTDYTRITEERIVLPHTTVHVGEQADPDSTTADILFFSVTYDLNGGSYNSSTADIKQHYKRTTPVNVDAEITPTLDGFDFIGWELDNSSTIVNANDPITDQQAGIAQPHTLTAQWTKALRANVNVNLTIHHHTDPAVTNSIGMNNDDSGVLDLYLTYRQGNEGDYYEHSIAPYSGTISFTGENTRYLPADDPNNTNGYATKTTLIKYESTTTGFEGLALGWEYSANILLEDYFLTNRTVTTETNSDGNITYNVDATLQYRPDLFNLSYTVIADNNLIDNHVPSAVDIKLLAYDNTVVGQWAPISRHTNTSVDVKLTKDVRTASGSYPVPVAKPNNDTLYYRAAAVGFTLQDGTELAASSANLIDYYSTATGSTAVYSYAQGAYYATVTVEGGATEGSMDAVYANNSGVQQGTITITVSDSDHIVTLDHNDKDGDNDTKNIIPHSFRLPQLSTYIPERAGNYVFLGWYTKDGSADGNWGEEAVSSTPISAPTTLYAKWQDPLTVEGSAVLTTYYTKNSQTYYINDQDLPQTVTVALERKYPITGVVEVVQTKTYDIDYTTYSSNNLGVANFEFDPVKQDGSQYTIHVHAANYESVYMVEPTSTGSTQSTDILDTTKYGHSNTVIDSNKDNTALVYVYMSFEPEEFDLTWDIDSSLITDNAVKPQSLDVVVTYYTNNSWYPISQHYQGGNYLPVTTPISAQGSESVWSSHPDGTDYEYSLRILGWKDANGTTHNTLDDAPFSISLNPTTITAESGTTNIDIKLTPKTYNINYELGTTAGNITGFSGVPTTYTWGTAATIDTELSRTGYDFLGWQADINNAYDNGTIKAGTVGNITLTARWKQQKSVTFNVINGKFTDDSTSKTVYVSLDAEDKADIKSIIPAATANYGFGNGTWGADNALLTGDTVIVNGDAAVTYTLTYERLYVNVGYNAFDNLSDNTVATTDSNIPYGNYIVIDKADGSALEYLKLEADHNITDPTRAGYIFAGWSRHFINDNYADSIASHKYIAIWLPDQIGENEDPYTSDGIADKYQKQIFFKIINGTWDGVADTADRLVVVTLRTDGNLDTNGTATIPSSKIPNTANAKPYAGYIAQDAFWDPSLPAENKVSGNDTETFTYQFYTTVTWKDYVGTDTPVQDIAHILPGNYITVDPNGGSWNGALTTSTIQVNSAYNLTDPIYADHIFIGWKWERGTDPVSHTYVAQWKEAAHLITWQNEDGTVISSAEVDYNTVPAAPTTPTKDGGAQYTYTFAGWEDIATNEVYVGAVPAVTKPATYRATFNETTNKYTVTWANHDSSVIDTDELEYGTTPNYTGTTPTKPATDKYTYTFNVWSPAITSVTGNITYTAQFTETINKYTITWQKEDGTTISSAQAEYDAVPAAPAAPAKENTAQYTYTFAGWMDVATGTTYAADAIPAVKGNTTYKATYGATVNQYLITWLNDDDSDIDSGNVAYGTIPTKPADPTKTADDQYTYTFAGWEDTTTHTVYTGNVPAVTKAATYKAVFNNITNTYTVTWLNYNGMELEKDKNAEYGSPISFDSTNKLTKEDANSFYTFLGWYLADDSTQAIVDLTGATVTGNVTYKAKYETSPKPRNVTINVWLNATAADGTGGTRATIGTVTNGEKSNLWLAPKNSTGDSSTYIAMEYNTTTNTYNIAALPGDYYIYAGNTAATATQEATQMVSVSTTDITLHTFYNSLTYDAVAGEFSADVNKLTTYYKSGSGPINVIKNKPTWSGYVFSHWFDGTTTYQSSTDMVPILLTDSIVKEYTLQAQYVEAATVQVIVTLDHKSQNSNVDPQLTGGFTNSLNIHLTEKQTTGTTYTEAFGKGQTIAATDTNWVTDNTSQTSTVKYTYADLDSRLLYSANATFANYDKIGETTVEKNGNNYTVKINLQYDPAGFDLKFTVKMAEGTPDNLVPRAVDVKLAYYDRAAGSWKLVSTFADKSIEVPLAKVGGIWQGTGTYHVWGKYTTGTYADKLYLYRLVVDDFDLGTNRGILKAAATTDFVAYSSAAGSYHQPGAYTAAVTVNDISCSLGEAGSLKGAHLYENGGTREQHGTLDVVVTAHPYDVVLNYQDGRSESTYEDRFLMPDLGANAAPTRAGYTFGGWYTKDGTADDWGTKAPATGAAIKTYVTSGNTLNLYAKWNKDYTITGKVDVSNTYQHTMNGSTHEHAIPVTSRANTVKVQLLRTNGGTSSVIATQDITVTDVIASGETAETAKYRTGTYSFANVPNDGSKYAIIVSSMNFTETFQNEPNSLDPDNTTYNADNTVVDNNGDSTAVVNVNMTFNPADFDLEFTVDASSIGAGFRPSTTSLVILANNKAPSETQTEPQTWPIISQMQQSGSVEAHAIAMDTDGSAMKNIAGHDHDTIWHHYSVWQSHPANYLYGYAISLYSATIGSDSYTELTNAANLAAAPFTVTYSPVRAWYDTATGKQTSPGSRLTPPDASNPHGLVAFLIPKDYTITYELGHNGTVTGATAIDGNTAKGSYTWSKGLGTMPTATTSLAGVSFEGWYTDNTWTTKVTEIDASSMENITLYARWNYTINWVNADNTPLDTDTVPAGEIPAYTGATPIKAADAQYTYTFNGWSPDVAAVTGNATYKATYTSTVNTYTVTWVDENGTTELEKDENVPYGTVPVYNGATPTKAANAQYTYTFNGWDKSISAVTGDITYTATYKSTVNTYNVLWKNHDDQTIGTSMNVPYGTVPVYNGATPTKAADAQYTYTFSGWSPDVVAVTGAATYTAQFDATVNTYTVIWKNWNGTELEKDVNVPYGTIPSFDQEDPTRPATAQYTYNFLGWNKDQDPITGNTEFIATYSMITNTYTVHWQNWDGNELETDYNIGYGGTPVYNSATPTKPADEQYTYTFSGWSPAVGAIDGETTYTAQFSQTVNKYTVTWKNGDMVIKTEQLEYGTTPSYTGTTPTKAADAQYTYTFSGWSPTIETVTDDATYTATYAETVNKYTVKWINWDGTELEKDENVPYGDTPSYDGATPTRPADGSNTYTFTNWDKTITAVNGDIIYQAVYSSNAIPYIIKWINYNGDELATKTHYYNDVLIYPGITPEKPADAQYTYTFKGWDPAMVNVTENATYTATYDNVTRSYLITWKNGDTVLKSEMVEYGVTPVYTGTTPTKAATAQYTYTHNGWDTTPVAVTGPATYNAKFDATVNTYTVTWVNENGTELEKDTNVPYGDTPSYDGATPTKAATAHHSFTFNGWDNPVVSVTGDVTYKATYTFAVNKYLITWLDEDGTTVLKTEEVAYAATPDYGTPLPTKAATAQYTYTFDKWTPAVVAVTGAATYTATYAETVNKYIVTWKHEDGTLLEQDLSVEYGTTPNYDGPTPTKTGNVQYSYTFDKWSPVIEEVTGDAIYTAEFTTTVNNYNVVYTDGVDGTEIFADETHTVPYGTATPAYSGTPSRSGYTFKGWIPAVAETVTGNATYTAQWQVIPSGGGPTTPTKPTTENDVPAAFTTEHFAYIIGIDGMVKPENNITRAEVATIFFRLLNEETRNKYLTETNSFGDSSEGMWFNTAVSTMAAMGVIKGMPDGNFHPSDKITRAEFAAIAARFDADRDLTEGKFSDISGHWAETEIKIAANNNWIYGYEDGTFKPNQNISRAEAMAMVNRVLKRDPESIEDMLPGMITWPDNTNTKKWYYLIVQEASNSHDYTRKANGTEKWTSLNN